MKRIEKCGVVLAVLLISLPARSLGVENRATFENIGIGGGRYMHSPSLSAYDKEFM